MRIEIDVDVAEALHETLGKALHRRGLDHAPPVVLTPVALAEAQARGAVVEWAPARGLVDVAGATPAAGDPVRELFDLHDSSRSDTGSSLRHECPAWRWRDPDEYPRPAGEWVTTTGYRPGACRTGELLLDLFGADPAQRTTIDRTELARLRAIAERALTVSTSTNTVHVDVAQYILTGGEPADG